MQWISVFAVLALVALLSKLIAQFVSVFGSEAPNAATLSALLIRSKWGHQWWLSLASALVVFGAARRLQHRSRLFWGVVAAATVTLAVSQTMGGHAATAVRPAFVISAQTMHLLAAGGWIGALAMLAIVAVPSAGSGEVGDLDVCHIRIAALVRSFSPLALGSSAILAATGVVIAAVNLGSLSTLWTTTYGRTLILKLVLLTMVAGVGAYNWRRVLPVLGKPVASARLRRSSILELLLATAVLAVTAMLVATPLPSD
ncbi:MAG: copper resistance D family protein [Gemmatimonas sp.]